MFPTSESEHTVVVSVIYRTYAACMPVSMFAFCCRFFHSINHEHTTGCNTWLRFRVERAGDSQDACGAWRARACDASGSQSQDGTWREPRFKLLTLLSTNRKLVWCSFLAIVCRCPLHIHREYTIVKGVNGEDRGVTWGRPAVQGLPAWRDWGNSTETCNFIIIIIICDLFMDAASSADYIALTDNGSEAKVAVPDHRNKRSQQITLLHPEVTT